MLRSLFGVVEIFYNLTRPLYSFMKENLFTTLQYHSSIRFRPELFVEKNYRVRAINIEKEIQHKLINQFSIFYL